jgi:protein translocase SecG subunit
VSIVLGILFGFVSLCIILLVLIQESKGGGISALGGAAMDNLIGGRNPLRKITVIFCCIFLVLVLAIGVSINKAQKNDVPEGIVLQKNEPITVKNPPVKKAVEDVAKKAEATAKEEVKKLAEKTEAATTKTKEAVKEKAEATTTEAVKVKEKTKEAKTK